MAKRKEALKKAQARTKNPFEKAVLRPYMHAAEGDPGDKDPRYEPAPPIWYGPEGQSIRRSTAGGLMREVERMFPRSPNYKLKINDPSQYMWGEEPRAFSSSAGIVNIPDIGDKGEGFFREPRYLHQVLAHEVAHNVDWMENPEEVKKSAHSKEFFRPKEKHASKSALLEPIYDPGDDVGLGGAQEYPARYESLGPYKQKYFIGLNPQDLSIATKQVPAELLARKLLEQRKGFASGLMRAGTSPSSQRVASLL